MSSKIKRKSACGTEGCDGKGHVDGVRATHRISETCPKKMELDLAEVSHCLKNNLIKILVFKIFFLNNRKVQWKLILNQASLLTYRNHFQ